MDSTRRERREPPEHCYIGGIVKDMDVRTQSRRRRTVVLALAAWTMLFVVVGSMTWPEPTAAHPAHVVSSVLGAEFAEVVEHPHLQDAPSLTAPDVFTAARLPRVATALVAVGLVIVVLVAVAGSVWSRALAVRGPPTRVPFAFPGRQLLTTLCVSRR